ncbi:MAG: polyamine aminopropyltransferase [Bacteroidales bacterium]
MRSHILKLSIFATGLAGIVAEYILSTLATYFLGDSILQWSLILSVMLFSMGLGSRISRSIKKYLAEVFISIELLLSLLASFSSILAYTMAGFSTVTWLVIYLTSISIGLLIGMEIPLVIRLNENYESLRVNISNVMEKDYYGSLVGGLFFAFVGLPYLGLTYTPFVLGIINFGVAFCLFLIVKKELSTRISLKLNIAFAITSIILFVGLFTAQKIILYGEQHRYTDKVVYAEQSRYQRIVITEWKNQHWLFLNGNEQLSSLDEALYHEVLVHPIMQLLQKPSKILILGGGDGCAVRELLKYPSIDSIVLVDLDPAMTRLAKENTILTDLNQNSLDSPKVTILNEDGFKYLETSNAYYDAIIVDLPDPKTVELSRLYSYEFYSLCKRSLTLNGAIITQAGSPYYATKAYNCIDTSMQVAGFNTLPLHNQIPTLGEWGWILGSKTLSKYQMKSLLINKPLPADLQTKWLNQDAMQLITSFGKDFFGDEDRPKVNRIHDPVLYRYYLKGNWDIY